MAKNTKKRAEALGATRVVKVPDTGGGAFGVARLGHIVETIQGRLSPGQGLRPGRPTDASWVRHPKVPMSEATRQGLIRLAEETRVQRCPMAYTGSDARPTSVSSVLDKVISQDTIAGRKHPIRWYQGQTCN